MQFSASTSISTNPDEHQSWEANKRFLITIEIEITQDTPRRWMNATVFHLACFKLEFLSKRISSLKSFRSMLSWNMQASERERHTMDRHGRVELENYAAVNMQKKTFALIW